VSTMKKKQRITGPVKVPENLQAVRHYLQRAFFEDEDLAKFTLKLEDGHLLNLEEMHEWLIEAIAHYEKYSPRAQALRAIDEVLKTQLRPSRQ
jgi:hypothetical protein